ncbi:MAG: hypothetical protein IJJ85_05045 [Clostridia bacterium]|nr:hypothetical protein [Clostridia bacterium]
MILLILLLVLTLSLPAGTLLCACFDLAFVPQSGGVMLVFSVLTALISACLLVLRLRVQPMEAVGAERVLFAILPLLLIVNHLFYLTPCFFSKQVGGVTPAAGGGVLLAIVSALSLSVLLGIFLMGLCVRKKALKVVSLIVTVLAGAAVFVISLSCLLLYDFGKCTVVKAVPSTQGTYVAEVVDVNDGALGGATDVYVYESRSFDTPLFRIYKKPKHVYNDEWGEYKNMNIYWENDTLLRVNGTRITLP